MKYYSVKEQSDSRIFFDDIESDKVFEGVVAKCVDFVDRNQICDIGLWKNAVNVFRVQEDGNPGKWKWWRSEFWGKLMRGASMVEAYSKNDGMYRILEASVKDMLTTQEDNGRISGYSIDTEFTSWDLWGRKYVMLGMMYFLEICRDPSLADKIINSLVLQADYIIAHIGKEKLDIRECSKHWEGMNSCSILEPMVRLYRITGKKQYLDFSEYIISTGFIKSANLIELAFENKISPYQYPVVKAYEMMSCFEGLLQYSCVTGNLKYRAAVLNFGYRILNEEISIIGCGGCTNELFDHTAIKQTQTDYDDIVQETCVSVTWMKLAKALLEISGDVRFADSIEQTFFNCYMGAFNTHRVPCCEFPKQNDLPQVMPFDSYSPLTADVRGRKVGGYGLLFDGTFYGCCASIGGAGTGLIPQFAILEKNDGFVLNYYEKGEIGTKTPDGNKIRFIIDTEYPYDGTVKIKLDMEYSEFISITLRIPEWCKSAEVAVNGKSNNYDSGYVTISREWSNNDEIFLTLPMRVQKILPPIGALNADKFVAYRRGPIILAADNRINSPDGVIDIICDLDGYADGKLVFCHEIPDCFECVEITNKNGKVVRLIDYSSAGKTFSDESKCAVWLHVK